MRDIFEEIFVNGPLDPVEAVRQTARPRLRQRFYKHAHVDQHDGGFAVRLDGRAVRTPARRVLETPTRALADALAAEWNAQLDVVDPQSMPLTRLANSILDGVADAPAAVGAEIEKYLASDLLVYRAEGPPGLVARQAQAWDPLIDWARRALGAAFVLVEGIGFVAQPAAALAAAGAAIPHDPWRLGALSAITTLTGSALIGLAVLAGRLAAEEAWAVAHVDEDWNMETWGRDAPALEQRASRFAEMKAAAQVLALLAAAGRGHEG
jgi:chaperone required for assembly of F1-ATPase